MTNLLRLGVMVAVAAGICAAAPAVAQTPFKLGTFQQNNRTFVGAVVDDSQVIDLSTADATIPRDMKGIIAGYAAAKPKIVAAVAKGARINISALTVLPPVMPRIILNATLNYQEHANELSKNPGI